MRKTFKPFLGFVLLTNIIFWIVLGLTGISLSLGAKDVVIKFAQVIGSWSSTFAFLILFKKIYPNIQFKDFIKQQFSSRIKISILISIIIIPVLTFIASQYLISGDEWSLTHTTLGAMIVWLLFNLIAGPTGEELGWRGYALNLFQQKFTPLLSALIIGIIWGLWHFPLWLMSGFKGVEQLKYCGLFMIAIVSFSVVMTYFYNKSRNLLVPIILHLLFNFLTSNIIADVLDIYLYTAICYLTVAVLLVLINPKQMLKKTYISDFELDNKPEKQVI